MSTDLTPPANRELLSPAVAPTPTGRGALVEDRLLTVLRRFGPLALRVTLAATFIWFGALKVAGVPTLPAGLIAAIMPAVEPALSVPIVGAFEIVLGLWLLTGWRQLLVLAAVMAHLTGTLLVLVVRPDVAFQGGHPLLLSVEGEYVIKNVVLLASVAVLAGLTHNRASVGGGSVG
jgi:putative oxidoreductase